MEGASMTPDSYYAEVAIASFPQTLSRAMRLPAFPSPTSCYFRPTFLMRIPETFPTRKPMCANHLALALARLASALG